MTNPFNPYIEQIRRNEHRDAIEREPRNLKWLCFRDEQKMKSRIACVKIEIIPADKDHPWLWPEAHELVWLFEVDENYSLDAVQQRFIEANRNIFGEDARVVCEIGRVKSYKKLLAWADRKGRNKHGLPPLTGWHGPVRLAPVNS